MKFSKPFKDKRGKWRIRWTDDSGKRHGLNFDTYQEAAFALRQKQQESAEIRAGTRTPTIEPKKFSELCDHYKKFYSEPSRNFRSERTNIEVHLRPHFGHLYLQEIGELQVTEFKFQRKHLSNATIHKQLTLLGTILRVAQDIRWLEKLPKIKKPKLILLDKNFHYLRTDEEIGRFLRTAKNDPLEMAYYLYATAVYTGLRVGELAGLNRADIDLDRNLITVNRSYEGLTKNGETRHVPILSILRPVIAQWLLRNPNKIVFPNEYGLRLKASSRIFQEVLKRTLSFAQFPKEERRGKVRHYITFHDLRHTFASHFMMNGGDLWKLKKILGHKCIQMTERYSHLSPSAFDEDFHRFGSEAPGFNDHAKSVITVNFK